MLFEERRRIKNKGGGWVRKRGNGKTKQKSRRKGKKGTDKGRGRRTGRKVKDNG